MNPIAEFVKENRKAAGLTQEQVNVALAMFNAQAVAGKKENK